MIDKIPLDLRGFDLSFDVDLLLKDIGKMVSETPLIFKKFGYILSPIDTNCIMPVSTVNTKTPNNFIGFNPFENDNIININNIPTQTTTISSTHTQIMISTLHFVEPKGEPTTQTTKQTFKKLKLVFVSKQNRLKAFNSEDKHKYFYIAQDKQPYYNDKNILEYPKQYTEINLNDKQLFIEQYLNKNYNLYEILTGDTKLKLFFDIEQDGNFSEDESNKKLNYLLQFLKMKIDETLKVKVDLINDVIILNSCTNEKLSYHIIFKKIIFENIATLDIFIKYIHESFINDVYYYDLIGKIIDTGIYNKNRCFRLINQSKINKDGILKNDSANISESWILVHEELINGIKLDDIKHLQNIQIKQKTNKDKQKLKQIQNKHNNVNQTNLRTIKNLSDEDLLKFKGKELYKRYLYLINQPAQWEDYFKIACVLAKYEAPIEDFKEWAQLHPDYNENDKVIIEYETKYKFYDKTKGYNLNTLRKLARYSEPDFFKNSPFDLNEQLFNLDFDDTFYIINETCKYIDENNNINLLNKNDSLFNFKSTRIEEDDHKFIFDRFIFLLAHMGKGKTSFILRFLKQNKKSKILFISSRCTFADYIEGDFNEIGLINYQSIKGKEINEDKIIISLESIHKLKNKDYDYVIIDECETVFKNLDGATMGGKTLDNFNILKELINNCQKCIIADAFITNRTITFFKQYQEPKTIIINTVPIIEREAIELHQEQMLYHMIEAFKRGENIYAVFGSERKMRQFIDELKDRKILKPEEILYYCASGNDKNKELLKDVNNNWNQYRAVFTTATITVGVSFYKIHFHSTFIVGYTSCTVRDLMQSHQRVRTLINNKIYYSLPPPKTYYLIKSMSYKYLQLYFNFDDEVNKTCEIHQQLINVIKNQIELNKNSNYYEENKKRIEDYEVFLNKLEEIPSDLKEIKKYNLLETALSNIHYNYIFRFYLKRCNYKIDSSFYKNYDDKEIDYEGDVERIETSGPGYRLRNDVFLNDEQALEIKEKVKNKQASEPDKINLDRYYFNKLLSNQEKMTDELFNYLYTEFWENKHKQFLIKNAKNEILNRYEFRKNKDEYEDEIGNKYTKDNLISKGFRLHYINILKEKLNISSSFEEQDITRDNINNCIEYLKIEKDKIYEIFNYKDQKQTIKELDFKTGLQTINKLFENFNGSKIIGDNKAKDRKGIYKSYIINKNNKIKNMEELFNVKINDLFKSEIDEEIMDYIPDFEGRNKKETEKTIYKNYCFIDE